MDSNSFAGGAAFFGIIATKRYYPVESIHEFFSSSDTKQVHGELVELVYFVSEEEAEARGFAPASGNSLPEGVSGADLSRELFEPETSDPFILRARSDASRAANRRSEVKGTMSSGIIEIECVRCGTINHLNVTSAGGVDRAYCTACNRRLFRETDEPDAGDDEPEENYDNEEETSSAASPAPLSSVVLGKDIETDALVTLTQEQRRKGTLCIGKTGSGKTTWVVNMILQDIEQGMGLCFFDTHGDAINDVLRRFPANRKEEDVILLDLLDNDYAFGLNLFQCKNPLDKQEVSRVTSFIMQIFAKLFTESGDLVKEATYMTETLQHVIPVLLAHQNPRMTMAEIPLLLRDEVARSRLLAPLRNPLVKSYWESYKFWKRDRQDEVTGSTLRRVDNFLTDPLILEIVGQSETKLDFRKIMDERKILLVKLSREHELITSLIGSVIVAQIANAAFSRKDTPEDQRVQFNLYADEYQRYATPTFAELLAEVRKFRIATCVAHQWRGQLDYANRGATLNAANMIVFQVSGEDGRELSQQFDCTPIRTKKVLKRRTKPIFKEWDEYVWGSEEEEKHAKELQERVAEAERNVEEAPRKRKQANLRMICAWALAQHFRNAFGVKSYADNAVYNHYSLSDLLEKAKTEPDTEKREQILTYLYHPFAPCWFEPNGEVKDYDFWISFWEIFWGKSHAAAIKGLELHSTYHLIENNLTLDAAESETASVSFYTWPEWHRGKTRDKDKKLISYAYQKRLEWYNCTGYAAISGLEYALRHVAWPENIAVDKVRVAHYPGYSLQREWNGKNYSLADTDPLFGKLLEEFIQEIHASLLRIYEGVRLKFIPRLAPYTNPFTLPVLAKETPPETGQRWTSWMWLDKGRWEMVRKPEFKDWLMEMVSRLEALLKECKSQVEQADQEEKQCKEQLAQLTKEWQAFQNQYRKVIHHKEYLGEQPEVEERTRISHSYSEGSSETVGISRTGTSHGYGTSASKSTSYSTDEVQWYDLVNELDQTPAERRDEIANELANPPLPFAARCKLGNREYTIQALQPRYPDPEAVWLARRDRIIENTRKNYYKNREEVVREIEARQNALIKRERRRGETTSDENEE